MEKFLHEYKRTDVEETCLWTEENISSKKDYWTQSSFRGNRTVWRVFGLFSFGTDFKTDSINTYIICFPLEKPLLQTEVYLKHRGKN